MLDDFDVGAGGVDTVAEDSPLMLAQQLLHLYNIPARDYPLVHLVEGVSAATVLEEGAITRNNQMRCLEPSVVLLRSRA